MRPRPSDRLSGVTIMRFAIMLVFVSLSACSGQVDQPADVGDAPDAGAAEDACNPRCVAGDERPGCQPTSGQGARHLCGD